MRAGRQAAARGGSARGRRRSRLPASCCGRQEPSLRARAGGSRRRRSPRWRGARSRSWPRGAAVGGFRREGVVGAARARVWALTARSRWSLDVAARELVFGGPADAGLHAFGAKTLPTRADFALIVKHEGGGMSPTQRVG